MADPRKPRRAAVLIITLVCVAVASSMLVSLAKNVVAGRRLMQNESRRLQAIWLAESALERAVWRLAADAAYRGETWTLSAEQLAGNHRGVVKIEVQTIPEQPDHRLVRVWADYPDHPQHRVRQHKEARVSLAQPTGE